MVYPVLLEWDGAYDLEIITDASYTVSGMDFIRRASNLKGANKDLWRLIYEESTTPPVPANSSAATVGAILRSPRSNRTATAHTSTAVKLPSGRLASMTWQTKLRTYSATTSATSTSSEISMLPRPNPVGLQQARCPRIRTTQHHHRSPKSRGRHRRIRPGRRRASPISPYRGHS